MRPLRLFYCLFFVWIVAVVVPDTVDGVKRSSRRRPKRPPLKVLQQRVSQRQRQKVPPPPPPPVRRQIVAPPYNPSPRKVVIRRTQSHTLQKQRPTPPSQSQQQQQPRRDVPSTPYQSQDQGQPHQSIGNIPRQQLTPSIEQHGIPVSQPRLQQQDAPNAQHIHQTPTQLQPQHVQSQQPQHVQPQQPQYVPPQHVPQPPQYLQPPPHGQQPQPQQPVIVNNPPQQQSSPSSWFSGILPGGIAGFAAGLLGSKVHSPQPSTNIVAVISPSTSSSTPTPPPASPSQTPVQQIIQTILNQVVGSSQSTQQSQSTLQQLTAPLVASSVDPHTAALITSSSSSIILTDSLLPNPPEYSFHYSNITIPLDERVSNTVKEGLNHTRLCLNTLMDVKLRTDADFKAFTTSLQQTAQSSVSDIQASGARLHHSSSNVQKYLQLVKERTVDPPCQFLASLEESSKKWLSGFGGWFVGSKVADMIPDKIAGFSVDNGTRSDGVDEFPSVKAVKAPSDPTEKVVGVLSNARELITAIMSHLQSIVEQKVKAIDQLLKGVEQIPSKDSGGGVESKLKSEVQQLEKLEASYENAIKKLDGFIKQGETHQALVEKKYDEMKGSVFGQMALTAIRQLA